MKKKPVAADPDAYVNELDGWRFELVRDLRKRVVAAARLEEVIKWGHLVYMGEGPVLLIRAEKERVLFGYWRGKRLVEIEPRLKPSGKYEMATAELREGDSVKASVITRLTKAAAALNEEHGDPRLAAPRKAHPTPRRKRGE